jgi:hypothetical protein
MAGRSDIFAKRRLTACQLRSVAERRFADARCLLDSGDSERSNGAIYMAGFVIECLLKALLLDRHPNLSSPVDPAKLSRSDREVFEYLYSHELDQMLGVMPELATKLRVVKTKSGLSVWQEFTAICAQWTIYARYSPATASRDMAARYLETVEEVKKWLKEL